MARGLETNYFPAVFKDIAFDSWTVELVLSFCHGVGEGDAHPQTEGLGGHLINVF